MPASKAAQPVFSNQTGTATSPPIDVSTAYAIQLYADAVTTTGLSTQATIQVQLSPDNATTWYSPGNLMFGFGVAPTTTVDMVIDIPITATKVRVVFTQSGSGTTTLNAQIGLVTGV